MAKSFLKTWSPEVLTYRDGKRRRRHCSQALSPLCLAQDPPLPERCDNKACRFHTEPLIWNTKPFKPILDHKNGVNTDNRPCNLQFLCPNCDSQNSETRGGANKGRVQKSSGGFATVEPDGRRSYVLPAESGRYVVAGRAAKLVGPSGSEPEDPR